MEKTIDILVRNPNIMRSHTQKKISVPAEFQIRTKDGEIITRQCLNRMREPARLPLPAMGLSRHDPIDKNNIESAKLFKQYKMAPSADYIEISDPEAEAENRTSLTLKTAGLITRLTDMYKAGQHEMLGNFLRRRQGDIRSLSTNEVFNSLVDLASAQPDFIEGLLSEQFNELTFLVDRAVEARALVKQESPNGDFYYRPKTNRTWGSLQQLLHELSDTANGLADSFRIDSGATQIGFVNTGSGTSSYQVNPNNLPAGTEATTNLMSGPSFSSAEQGLTQANEGQFETGMDWEEEQPAAAPLVASEVVEKAIAQGILEVKAFGRIKDSLLSVNEPKDKLIALYSNPENASLLATLAGYLK